MNMENAELNLQKQDLLGQIMLDDVINIRQSVELKKKAKLTFIHSQQEKANIKGSRGLLLISVGQPRHEGLKFAATTKMANKTFSSCDVAVCDVLQRHTMEIYEDLPKEELYEKANKSGEEWIKRNDEALKEIKIPHEIFRWEKYLLNNDFNKHREELLIAYKQDLIFAKAVDETIYSFITRIDRHSYVKDKRKAFNCCFNYFIEEYSIIMRMWPSCGYNYVVYPGPVVKAYEISRNKFVDPLYPNLLKWLGIYVRTREKNKQSSRLLQEKLLEINVSM